MRTRQVLATDGEEYDSLYLSWFQRMGGGEFHPFADLVLAPAHQWEALGFITWLYRICPRVSLDYGGQSNRLFPGHLPGKKLRGALEDIGFDHAEACRLLKILEECSLISVMQDGTEVVRVELRVDHAPGALGVSMR